jgi:hypothetical protein
MPRLDSKALMPVPNHALSGIGGQNLVLLPIMFVRGRDPLGWRDQMSSPHEFLLKADSLMEVAVKGRAYRTKWRFPEQIKQKADESNGLIADPYTLAGAALLPGVWRTDLPLGDPLVSQLRGIVAIENARYALAPVEIHFIPYLPPPRAKGDTTTVVTPPPDPTLKPLGIAVLRVMLLDPAATQVVWAGDVISDTARTPDGTLQSLTAHLGDVLGAP